MEEGPKYTVELHDSPFPNEHDLILWYPLGMVHQGLGAIGDPHKPPEHPQWALEVTEGRNFIDALPKELVQLPHGRLDGVIVRAAEELINEARRRRRPGGRGGVERVGCLSEEEYEEVGGRVLRAGRGGEGVGVPGDDARVGEDEGPEVRDGGREARPESGVADGGDLTRLVGGAAEGGDEEGEGGRGPGGRVREREAVDEEALGGVAQGEERARLGEELGGGELEVGDGGAGVGRRREGDEEDLAEDDVLHLVRRALWARGSRRWGRHRRRAAGGGSLLVLLGESRVVVGRETRESAGQDLGVCGLFRGHTGYTVYGIPSSDYGEHAVK